MRIAKLQILILALAFNDDCGKKVSSIIISYSHPSVNVVGVTAKKPRYVKFALYKSKV